MSHSHPDGTLSDVLDGQLDDRASRAWQQHLTDCAECRAELAQLRLVQRAAREWTPSDTGADHWPALRAKVMAADVTAISQPRRPRRRTEASIAAATLAVAAMLVLIFRTRVPTPAWPSEVAASVSTVAALDTTTRPLLDGLDPRARTEFTTLLADADASLREIETLRAEAVDTALLTEVYLQALDSKHRLLEGIRDYHHESE